MTDQTITLKVPEDCRSIRIDKFIAANLDSISRNRIQTLINQSSISINNSICTRSSEKVAAGDLIEIFMPAPTPSRLVAEDIPIEILYQDSDIAVINKPWGMSVHPTETHISGTLVNALLAHITDLSGIGGVLRPGIVHRLDRVTSGVILVAKHDEAHRRLADAFKARQVKKTYWAIVHRQPNNERGEINQPIARHPSDRKRMAIATGGRPAVSRYEVLKTGLGGSWLAVYPVTGRTHQIRVHLRHLGCPIAGDKTYGLKTLSGRGELARRFAQTSGIGLHARRIELTHPMTGEPVVFEAEAPEITQSILNEMT